MERAGIHVGNLSEESSGFRGALDRMTASHAASKAERLAANRARLGAGAIPPGRRG